MVTRRYALHLKTRCRSCRPACAIAALIVVALARPLILRSHAFLASGGAQAGPRVGAVTRQQAPTHVADVSQLLRRTDDHSGPVQMEGPDFWSEVEKGSLQQVLAENGGIIKVSGLLPGVLASQTLARLEALPENEWTIESDQGTVVDQAITLAAKMMGKGKSAEYSYGTYNGHAINGPAGVIESLAGDHVISLKAARYRAGNSIGKHCDQGSSFAGLDTRTPLGRAIPFGKKLHRKIAFIWYLTPDWSESHGGCLVDHGSAEPRTIVPEFNSAIAFEVPRNHEVTKMVEGSPSRYTMFGWFSDEAPVSARKKR